MLGMTKPAAAQQVAQQVGKDAPPADYFPDEASGGEWDYWVEGTLQMTIIYSGTGAEILTYAETDASYDLALWAGWDVYAEWDLYLNGTKLGWAGAANCYDDWGLPAPDCQNLTNTISVSSTDNEFIDESVGYNAVYELDGYHFEDYLWEDYDEWEEDGSPLLTTQVDLTANWPYIATIEPNSVEIGTSGTMQLAGYNLLAPSTCSATWTLAPANGITLNLTGGDCEKYRQANLSYSVNGNQATEGSTVTLTWNNGYGTNQGTFLVIDPSPVITSVVPSTLPQGATQVPVTITGTGFGTKPSVTFSDPNIVAGQASVTAGLTSNGQLATSQTITVNVTVGSKAAIGEDVITVTSNGYGTAGGKPTPPPGGSLSATAPFTVGTASSYMPPPATILYFGQAVPATGQKVYVGQLIYLDTNAGPPLSELEPTSYYWTFPPNSAGTTGTVIASLSTPLNIPASTTGEVPTPLSPANQASAAISFYWINIGNSSPATYTVQFQYCVNGTTPSSSSPQCSTLSTATFNVAAPTGIYLTTTTGTVAPYPKSGTSYIGFILPGYNGITITANSVAKDFNNNNVAQQGSYQWVQLLNNVVSQYINSAPPYEHACAVFQDPQALAGKCGTPITAACSPELDNAYPYGRGASPSTVTTSGGPLAVENDTALDSPYWQLYPSFGEQQRYFDATMYLEWIPNAAALCNVGSACTIPVPLGGANWFWTGDAINTLTNQNNSQSNSYNLVTTWYESCSLCSQGDNVTNQKQFPIDFQAANPSPANNYSYLTWNYTCPSSIVCINNQVY
jgi:hypothetical protein